MVGSIFVWFPKIKTSNFNTFIAWLIFTTVQIAKNIIKYIGFGLKFKKKKNVYLILTEFKKIRCYVCFLIDSIRNLIRVNTCQGVKQRDKPYIYRPKDEELCCLRASTMCFVL